VKNTVVDRHLEIIGKPQSGLLRQPIKILNSDGLLHNVHALPKINKTFNMAMPASRTEATVTFDKEEFMFKMKCDVHPWMGAYIAVLSHPFFDVTGADGKFEIKDVPAGTYEVEIWHEKLGAKTTKVTVSGDEQLPNFSVGGLLFGDFYHVVSHHTEEGEGATGAVIRRGYLTFDADFTGNMFGRMRFELNQAGEFETYTFDTKFKDLFLG